MNMAETRIERFTRAWEQAGGGWEHQPDPASARLALLLRLRQSRVRRLAAPALSSLPIPGLAEALRDAGFILLQPKEREPIEEMSISIVAAHAALAATGSLVFSTLSPKHWLIHLLSSKQIVLLPTSVIYDDIAAWRTAWIQEGLGDACAAALIVSGPSVTRDMDLTPHLGMFGPRDVHVILFDVR